MNREVAALRPAWGLSRAATPEPRFRIAVVAGPKPEASSRPLGMPRGLEASVAGAPRGCSKAFWWDSARSRKLARPVAVFVKAVSEGPEARGDSGCFALVAEGLRGSRKGG